MSTPQTPPAVDPHAPSEAHHAVEGDPGQGAPLTPAPGLPPPLDARTAAEVTAKLVADALTGHGIVHGGDWYDTATVRIRRDPDGTPREIGLVIADGTRGDSILATILIASVPIGA